MGEQEGGPASPLLTEAPTHSDPDVDECLAVVSGWALECVKGNCRAEHPVKPAPSQPATERGLELAGGNQLVCRDSGQRVPSHVFRSS